MFKKTSGFMRLTGLLSPHKGKLLLCFLCLLGVNAAEIIKPLAAALIIDGFLSGAQEQRGLYSLEGISLGYMLLILCSVCLSVLQVRLITRISQGILHELRLKVFAKITRMSVKTLDGYGTGRLITRATNDVETINEFYSDVFMNLFKDVLLLTGIVIIMFSLDWRLATAAFTGIPVIAALTIAIRGFLKRNFRRMKQVIGQINGFFSENVQGMRIVRAFGRELDKLREFRELNKAYFKTTKTQVMLNSFLRPIMEVINNIVIALLIALGWRLLTEGSLNVGLLYAFTTYVRQFFEPINDLADKYTTVQSALISAERIYGVLDDEGIEPPYEGTYGGEAQGTIEFKDVWFAYNDEDWVLKGLSLRVEKGQRAALVGATGAGKSTIVSLLTRDYEPQRGEITVDGIPLSQWQRHALRRSVAAVLQDVFLFTGTVRESIDLFDGLPDEELRAALATAGAEDFIDEAGGLDAAVSEQGLNFSAGQRQLLSFARAAARKPAILVLDEATAYIDSATEELVQRSIDRISAGRTAVFIAHRLSTIRGCDKIFVLSGGKIIESGTHEQLLRENGEYARLVNA